VVEFDSDMAFVELSSWPSSIRAMTEWRIASNLVRSTARVSGELLVVVGGGVGWGWGGGGGVCAVSRQCREQHGIEQGQRASSSDLFLGFRLHGARCCSWNVFRFRFV
jgi:hypothetical protein